MEVYTIEKNFDDGLIINQITVTQEELNSGKVKCACIAKEFEPTSIIGSDTNLQFFFGIPQNYEINGQLMTLLVDEKLATLKQGDINLIEDYLKYSSILPGNIRQIN